MWESPVDLTCEYLQPGEDFFWDFTFAQGNSEWDWIPGPGEAVCPWIRVRLGPGSGRGCGPLDPGEATRPWVRVTYQTARTDTHGRKLLGGRTGTRRSARLLGTGHPEAPVRDAKDGGAFPSEERAQKVMDLEASAKGRRPTRPPEAAAGTPQAELLRQGIALERPPEARAAGSERARPAPCDPAHPYLRHPPERSADGRRFVRARAPRKTCTRTLARSPRPTPSLLVFTTLLPVSLGYAYLYPT
ncbi:hypothetical protein QTO34_015561 [Cnephaeus nilssonii]|uniref:Uncharacterized protein n=1 Tax=Cnephaeus nilssonii TaxID=3371016 RepID=A0AA40LT78_CNENI|nr:hypothetical protein QTO34_015561 [Eptesicus nilssonii]